MSLEIVARRFSRRTGFDLIDYAEVAMPLYRLTIDAVTLNHQPVPAIKEFALRSIESGFSEQSEIAAFLGLDEQTIGATLSQLQDERYAEMNSDKSEIQLLEQGKRILREAKEIVPQDETLVVLYDRVLRRPVWFGGETLLSPSELDRRKTIEIRPYPAEGPSLSDISLHDVAECLKKQATGGWGRGKELLKLKRILRRVRRYRSAIALVYKKHRSSDLQIAFIVDDARNEDLERAFAEAGGPVKMGFVQTISESAAASALRRHLGNDIVDRLPDPKLYEDNIINVSTSKLKVEIANQRLNQANERNQHDVELENALHLALTELEIAEGQLNNFPARAVEPYECPELLSKALKQCKTLLAISSFGLDPHIVTQDFVASIGDALARNVDVHIVLNSEYLETYDAARTYNPLQELRTLTENFKNLAVSYENRRRNHFLIKDNEFALIINRPLLSNIKKVRTFHHNFGYILRDSNLVSIYASKAIGVPTARP